MHKTATAQLLSRLNCIGMPPGSDCQLLEQFHQQRDEGTFAELVERHGPMVLGVCRRVIGSLHDAEEAFQATFLLLAQKGHRVVPGGSVGPWLHGVAYRVALKTRTMLRRRQFHERQAARLRHESSTDILPSHDLRSILDQELQQLPLLYRSLVILCDMQGGTFRSVARQLNLPVGTLSGRLKRGRELLAQRLQRRGIVLSTGSLALALAEYASAQAPAFWIASTVHAAVALTTSSTVTTALVPSSASTFVKGTVVAMMLNKLKLVSCLGALAVVLAAGWLLNTSSVTLAQDKPDPRSSPHYTIDFHTPSMQQASPQYLLQLQVFEQSGDSKNMQAICAPRLITHANAKATIQTSEMQKFKSSKILPDWAIVGFEAELEVQPQKDGTLILQLKAERRKVRDASSDQYITQSYSESYVKACRLNETLDLPWEPFGKQGKLVVQVMKVEAAPPQPPKAAVVKQEKEAVAIPLSYIDAISAVNQVRWQYPSLQVETDTRTNSLIVVCSPAEMKVVKSFIKHMDVAAEVPHASAKLNTEDQIQTLQVPVSEQFNMKSVEEAVRKINESKPKVEVSYHARKHLLTIKVLASDLKMVELKTILEAGR